MRHDEPCLVHPALRAGRLVSLAEPSPFHAIGLHHADFHPMSDDEVLAALRDAARGRAFES
jgi:predicted phosphoribosyltransferase